MADLRTELLKKITELSSPETVRIWLEDCGFVGLRNEKIEIELSSDFKRKMTEIRLGTLVRNAVSQLTGMEYPVCFVTKLRQTEKQVGAVSAAGFESFIKGKGNEFALACVLAATDRPNDRLKEPVYIYGAENLGKSHLLRAAQNRLEKLAPGIKAVYLSAEELKELFCPPKTDYLLIDDFSIDQSGKLQSYLRTALNERVNIIAAGRIPPDETTTGAFVLPGTDIICSPADIQPPDIETLQAINMEKELRNGRIAAVN